MVSPDFTRNTFTTRTCTSTFSSRSPMSDCLHVLAHFTILDKTFSFLSPKELKICSLVCKSWEHAARSILLRIPQKVGPYWAEIQRYLDTMEVRGRIHWHLVLRPFGWPVAPMRLGQLVRILQLDATQMFETLGLDRIAEELPNLVRFDYKRWWEELFEEFRGIQNAEQKQKQHSFSKVIAFHLKTAYAHSGSSLYYLTMDEVSVAKGILALFPSLQSISVCGHYRPFELVLGERKCGKECGNNPTHRERIKEAVYRMEVEIK